MHGLVLVVIVTTQHPQFLHVPVNTSRLPLKVNYLGGGGGGGGSKINWWSGQINKGGGGAEVHGDHVAVLVCEINSAAVCVDLTF